MYDTYKDTSDYDHAKYMRRVHKERGTVEIIAELSPSLLKKLEAARDEA